MFSITNSTIMFATLTVMLLKYLFQNELTQNLQIFKYKEENHVFQLSGMKEFGFKGTYSAMVQNFTYIFINTVRNISFKTR